MMEFKQYVCLWNLDIIAASKSQDGTPGTIVGKFDIVPDANDPCSYVDNPDKYFSHTRRLAPYLKGDTAKFERVHHKGHERGYATFTVEMEADDDVIEKVIELAEVAQEIHDLRNKRESILGAIFRMG